MGYPDVLDTGEGGCPEAIQDGQQHLVGCDLTVVDPGQDKSIHHVATRPVD